MKLALSLLIMAIVFVIILLLLNPIRNSLFSWHDNLSDLGQLIFDLIWIGVVAIMFAGILAPLDSLGWWAGWYGDDLDTVTATETTAINSSTPHRRIAMWCISMASLNLAANIRRTSKIF